MRRVVVAIALSPCACGPGDGALEHDIVKLDFARGQSQDTDPFGGVVDRIVVVANYGECLAEFYDDHPDGDDDQLFASAVAHLCDPAPAMVSCVVETIEQRLDAGDPYRLVVVYETSGELQAGYLPIGPFPTTDSADCRGNAPALISLEEVTATNGDVEAWQITSFSPSEVEVGGTVGASIPH